MRRTPVFCRSLLGGDFTFHRPTTSWVARKQAPTSRQMSLILEANGNERGQGLQSAATPPQRKNSRFIAATPQVSRRSRSVDDPGRAIPPSCRPGRRPGTRASWAPPTPARSENRGHSAPQFSGEPVRPASGGYLIPWPRRSPACAPAIHAAAATLLEWSPDRGLKI